MLTVSIIIFRGCLGVHPMLLSLLGVNLSVKPEPIGGRVIEQTKAAVANQSRHSG